MNWNTIVPLVIGAVITLVSTFSATTGVELLREKRQVKQKKAELEDERIRSLQNALGELARCVNALGFEYSVGLIQRDSRRSTTERLVNDAARLGSQIAITSTRLTDSEARAIGEEIRAATRQLTENDEKKFKKGVEAFNVFALEANERLGAVIRRRMD